MTEFCRKSCYSIISLFLIFSTACLEDLNEPPVVKYSYSAELITEIETNTDFINTDPYDIIRSATQIRNVEGMYLYLDIRTPEEFTFGHIPGARNLNISELIDTLSLINYRRYKRVTVVSKTGHKAAYAASLLRIYGFANILSLDYGMGQWHADFSEPWINARSDSYWWSSYNRVAYAKPKVGNKLPALNVDDPSLSTKEILRRRIRELLTDAAFENCLTSIEELDDSYSLITREYDEKFIICFAEQDLYNYTYTFRNVAPPVTRGGHPPGAVMYSSLQDFKGSVDLLSLPLTREITIYDYNGQSSAILTAYLRLLGYDAKFLKFGAVSMFYNKLRFHRSNRSFQESKIYNYFYVR